MALTINKELLFHLFIRQICTCFPGCAGIWAKHQGDQCQKNWGGGYTLGEGGGQLQVSGRTGGISQGQTLWGRRSRAMRRTATMARRTSCIRGNWEAITRVTVELTTEGLSWILRSSGREVVWKEELESVGQKAPLWRVTERPVWLEHGELGWLQ